MSSPTLPRPDEIRLVVTDMDGTLLDPDGAVPDGLWPLLERMHDAGITFVPASGRQHATIAASFPATSTPGHDELVIIAENGTLVTRGGQEVSSETLDRDGVTAVVRAVRGLSTTRDGGAVLAGKRGAYVERGDDAFVDHIRTYYRELTVVDDLLAVDDEVLKVAVYDDVDSATGTLPALVHLRATHQVVVSSPHWIDVMPPGVNKGRGLRRLQTELGVTPAQTMVFGDYLNDIEMLDAAEWSFAMSGAHPDVLAHARYTAPGNAEHGVVQVLAALLEERGSTVTG
ncbi:Cof-type HAD-IIB family hydrolase [Isoptericola croceus]|uniref:Cof-type HAD-IIB family hydrolase n=1 Tax=Isoptericola croceus TaxID=3031406 RepID=UPI0023F6B272|nr:Cof-type HAD-IIB family hydrolase [Isoptericola croceus]